MSNTNYTPAELRERGALKWTVYPDSLGAFIAEGDFGTAPAVHRALDDLKHKELFTYAPPWLVTELKETTAWHCGNHFDWDISPSVVDLAPDVITAFLATASLFTEPETPIVLLTPAYMPFFPAARTLGRQVREVPMLRRDDTWEVDETTLEQALAGGGLLVICNPHNPVGTVYSTDELLRISHIVSRTGSRVFADEVHAPLILDPRRHIPYASVSEAARSHTVTAISASKAFNIPGLKCAQVIFPDERWATHYADKGQFYSHAAANPGIAANIAAYREGYEWLEECLTYLRTNRDHLSELLAEHLPDARYIPPQGTYIAWLDLRAYNLGETPARYIREHTGVALTEGTDCGTAGTGHVRLTFATPRPIMEEMIQRMGKVMPRAAH